VAIALVVTACGDASDPASWRSGAADQGGALPGAAADAEETVAEAVASDVIDDGAGDDDPRGFAGGFDARRRCTGGGEIWEVCYGGVGLPGQGALPHLAWDNPVDDAWWQTGFRRSELLLDQAAGSTRFVRSNRGVASAPSWFHFRDPEIRRAEGIEMSVRVRVLSSSGPRAVFLGYIDEREQFALHFERGSIAFHPEANQRTGREPAGRVVVPLDLTTFREILVRKSPGSATVVVRERRADGSAPVLFTAPLAAGPAPTPALPFTRITFGDNEDATNGRYDLAHLRFRRALRTATTWPAKVVRPAPVVEPSQTHFLGGIGVQATTCVASSFTTFAALAAASSSGATCKGYLRAGGGTPADRSACAAESLVGAGGVLTSGTIRAFDQRLVSESGSTIDLRFRFAPTFAVAAPLQRVEIAGLEGASSFGLSLGRADLLPRAYGKPVTQLGALAPPYTASSGWNTLRIVRAAGSIYENVYLNGVLVLRDMKSGHADQPGTLRLGVGLGQVPVDAGKVWTSGASLPVLGWSEPASGVEVDCMRWSNRAYAPAPP